MSTLPGDELKSKDNQDAVFINRGSDENTTSEESGFSAENFLSALDEVAVSFSEDLQADLISINSEMNMDIVRNFIGQVMQYKRHDQLLLFLTTPGGEAGAAYKIASFAHEQYKDGFSIVINDYCKSAGTICALGANELVISDKGELGPIDVQLGIKENDGFWEFHSGLEIDASFDTLNQKVLDMFVSQVDKFMGEWGGAVSLAMATKIATRLTVGVFAPLYTRFDPLDIGRVSRGMNIAMQYGLRLAESGGNLLEDEEQPHSLLRLTYGYPEHGFVIDRAEAKKLFKQVRAPNEWENMLADGLEYLVNTGFIIENKDRSVWFLSPPREDEGHEGDDHDEED